MLWRRREIVVLWAFKDHLTDIVNQNQLDTYCACVQCGVVDPVQERSIQSNPGDTFEARVLHTAGCGSERPPAKEDKSG